MNKIPYKICVGMASGQPYRLRHKCTKGEGPKDWAFAQSLMIDYVDL